MAPLWPPPSPILSHHHHCFLIDRPLEFSFALPASPIYSPRHEHGPLFYAPSSDDTIT